MFWLSSVSASVILCIESLYFPVYLGEAVLRPSVLYKTLNITLLNSLSILKNGKFCH